MKELITILKELFAAQKKLQKLCDTRKTHSEDFWRGATWAIEFFEYRLKELEENERNR